MSGERNLQRAALKASAKPVVILAFALCLVEVGSTLAFPLLAKSLIDHGIAVGSPWSPRFGLAGMLIAVLVLGSVAGTIGKAVLSRVSFRVAAGLRALVFARLLRRPLASVEDDDTSRGVSHVISDVQSIARLFTVEAQGLIAGISLLVGSIVILATLDLKLTLTIFGSIFGAFLLSSPAFFAIAAASKKINAAAARLTQSTQHPLQNIRTVKAFIGERHEDDRHEIAREEAVGASSRAAIAQAVVEPLGSISLSLSLVIIMVYGGSRVVAGSLSAGTLTAFILYVFNVAAPLMHLSKFFVALAAAKGASEKLNEVLACGDERDGDQERSSSRASLDSKGLEIRDLMFSYQNDGPVHLSVPHLYVSQGEKVAIVGPSGAGKSTLLSLLLRFRSPDRGVIRWNGRDIRDISLDEWRSTVSIVSDRIPLMRGTIAENIAYGSSMVTPKAVREAADLARCTGFVQELPEGFETQIGPDADRLSAGQRQRLALARAIARNSDIILMDEGTSNLDEANEGGIVDTILTAMPNQTIIFITHKPSLAARFDKIAVIEQGRLVSVDSSDAATARGCDTFLRDDMPLLSVG